MGRTACMLWLVGWLWGCGATEGPLLVAAPDTRAPDVTAPDAGAGAVTDAGAPASEPPSADAGTPDATDTAAPAGPVQPGMALQYQLLGPLDSAVEADFFVVDLFEVSAADVADLKQRGRAVAAYIAAGSHEPWRPDADDFPESALGEPLANYPNERWLDIRDGTVRELQAMRVALAAEKGFDGVMLVSLDAYERDSGYPLTADDQLDYARYLAAEAHARGLLAGLADGWVQAELLAPVYDFAIHINCVAAGSCAQLSPYSARGLPVFDLETAGTPEEICPRAEALGLPVTLKRDSFDAWLHICP